ncbi:alpha-tocopherol transfer protein-like [Ptychodera flava]|uniref:alpha-tocopherol transfer protein-like n=1 Tax=Ptychodera flava TaxID=63121 RepID=UPI003969FAC4
MPFKESDTPYVCTLSEELQDIAKRELNEDPATRSGYIQTLRALTNTRADIKFRRDDAFLLRFLRAKKFDVKRAFQQLCRYYEVRREYREVFDELRPSKIQHVWDMGMDVALPDRDSEGRRILIFRPGKWNPDVCPAVDSMKATVITVERLLEEEETQINGVVFIGDFIDYSMKQAVHIGPYFARMNTSILQNAMPMRIKGFHFINTPTIFEAGMALWRPLMSEKMRQRMHLHGDEYGTLHKHIPSAVLPTDCGGTSSQLDTRCREWMEKLLEFEDKFVFNNETFGPPKKENTLGGTSQGADPNMGLVGSFKKLDV